MSKVTNLTPKFKIPSAEKELTLEVGQVAMGSRQGGLSMFSNKFRSGHGDSVFGSDENGIWLGSAEFNDAPFRVSKDGKMIMESSDGKSVKISAEDNTIIVNDGDDDIILIGYQEDGF